MVLDLLLLGIAIAVDPIPLGAFIVLLPSRNGVRKGAGFIFGWLVSLAIVVSVTVLATGNNPPRPNTVPSLASLAARIAIGVVLVVIAARQRRKMGAPKKPKKPPKWQASVDDMSPWFAVGLGPLVQPWGLIAAGAATVVEAKVTSVESFLALFFFCVLGTSSYLALELFAAFRPERSQAFMDSVKAWIEGHTDQVIVIGALVLGFWLISQSLYLILTSGS